MKLPNLFTTDIPTNIQKDYLNTREFREDLISHNIRRGKLLAIIVIAFEIVLLIVDILSWLLKVSSTFSYYSYLAMYGFMIALNLMYLYTIRCYSQKKISMDRMNRILVVYITLIMVWGGIISLLDQRLYGHLMSFMVNMIVCSIIYLVDVRTMLISYLISTLALAIGLPFFQSSSNILIGHYVNLAVFVVIAWTASRINYRYYCDNYVIKALMNQANSLLEKEMEENRSINKKLAAANAQLKKLALVDELTGLPNRRSFREFIDTMAGKAGSASTVSIIMIDVDNFKQYNDFYGHEKGDLALIAVARQLNDLLENTEQMAIRWGGEEFIYIAFHKNQTGILAIANAIQSKIADLKIINQSTSISPYLTISLGTCTGTVTAAKDIGKIINTADQALYLAKSRGRNCVATLSCEESFTGEGL